MKFKSLRLRHFQSHPDTAVELSPGINAFVGESDNGKTACIRGLSWLATNSPSGDGFVSIWNKSPKGELLEPTVVEVVLDDERKLRRVRSSSPKRNGYDLDGEEFNAVRTDVPTQVAEALNLDVVNWQRQLDPPFLLSDSGGARARFFNQILKLEEIDACLSAIESRRRKVSGQIPDIEEAVGKAQGRLDALGWVSRLPEALAALGEAQGALGEAETALSALVRIQGNRKEVGQRFEVLSSVIDAVTPRIEDGKRQQQELTRHARDLNELAAIQASWKRGARAITQTVQIEGLDATGLHTLDGQIEMAAEEKGKLQLLLSRWIGARVIAARAVPNVEGKIELLQKYDTSERAALNDGVALGKIRDTRRARTHELETYAREIKETSELLPELCPLCGGSGKLKEHADVE